MPRRSRSTLRDLGQALANERGKLTPEQIRNREKELQDRIAESRRVFGERNRIIQEASQYVMAQIDRAVELVTQQVAISRGINLVLNRAQILGVTNEFDMTPVGGGEPEQGAGSGGDPARRRLAGGDAGEGRRHAGQRAGRRTQPAQPPAKPPAAQQQRQ